MAAVVAAVEVAGLPLLEAPVAAVVAAVEVVAERPLPAWQARPALPRFRLQK